MVERPSPGILQRVFGSGPTETEIKDAFFDEDFGIAIPYSDLLHHRLTTNISEYVPFSILGIDHQSLPTLVELTTENELMHLMGIIELGREMSYEELFDVFTQTQMLRKRVIPRSNGRRGPNFIEIYSVKSNKKELELKTVVEHDPSVATDQLVIYLHPENTHPSTVDHPVIGANPQILHDQIAIFGAGLRTTHAALTERNIFFQEMALVPELNPPHLSS